MNYNETTPAKPAEIPDALDQMEKSIVCLRDHVERLAVRLDIVMFPPGPEGVDDSSPTPCPVRSPAGERIFLLTERIDGIANAVNSIISRLAL